jgi:hypothetical protein
LSGICLERGEARRRIVITSRFRIDHPRVSFGVKDVIANRVVELVRNEEAIRTVTLQAKVTGYTNGRGA